MKNINENTIDKILQRELPPLIAAEHHLDPLSMTNLIFKLNLLLKM